MTKTVLILTSDPDSINYEIIKKSIFFFKKKRKNNYIFVGNKNDLKKKLKSDIKYINILNINKSYNIKNYLNNCFIKSFKLVKEKKAHAILNLPLNKKNLPIKYPGFTEFISNYFKTKNKETMLLYNHNFSVCPSTTHIPLKNIYRKINKKKIYNDIFNINKFYQTFIGVKKPKIIINGINPHNGADFNYLTEEKKILIPAIYMAKKKRIDIYGPVSPDIAFVKIKEKKINCLIGHYHDQVLPTFKYINKFNAINITLGLPFLRVSPDHGTASDIKNKNLASPDSFIYALKFFEKFSKKI